MEIDMADFSGKDDTQLKKINKDILVAYIRGLEKKVDELLSLTNIKKGSKFWNVIALVPSNIREGTPWN